jgi:hypothetical protein
VSAKSLFVLILFLAVVLVGGYLLFFEKKPAFDIQAFRSALDKTDQQMKAFSRLADLNRMPGWLRKKVDYYEDQARIIQENLPDCDAIVLALVERSRELMKEMQSIDQAAAMQEIVKGGRKQQTRMAATIFVVHTRYAKKLLPLIEEVCDTCPEESAVFNRVLSF